MWIFKKKIKLCSECKHSLNNGIYCTKIVEYDSIQEFLNSGNESTHPTLCEKTRITDCKGFYWRKSKV